MAPYRSFRVHFPEPEHSICSQERHEYIQYNLKIIPGIFLIFLDIIPKVDLFLFRNNFLNYQKKIYFNQNSVCTVYNIIIK